MKTDNSIFDIVKFILSLFIVAIHTSLFPGILYPWLRLAVPLFFIMSAYFFFGKLKSKNDNDRKIALKKYVQRNLRLYLFYFVLLLPITVYIRGWFSEGATKGLILFLRDLVFHSTFRASWFIMATVIATIMVYYSSAKLSNKQMFVITLFINIIVAIRSSYICIFSEESVIYNFFRIYDDIFTPACASFPVALFWIVCGKIFAECDILENQKTNVVLLIVSCGLLYAEWKLVAFLGGGFDNDCYIMLIPTCIFLFATLKELQPRCYPCGRYLRKLSVMTYTTHATVAMVVPKAVEFVGFTRNSLIVFVLTVLVCAIYCHFITWLEKHVNWKWLKYAY